MDGLTEEVLRKEWSFKMVLLEVWSYWGVGVFLGEVSLSLSQDSLTGGVVLLGAVLTGGKSYRRGRLTGGVVL